MAKETNYGIISDIHVDPRRAYRAIDVLKDNGAEKLFVNGDIGDARETIQESQDNIAVILDAVAKSNLESFVHPGSHETVAAYDPVINYFSDKFGNIVNTINNPKSSKEDHDLVFLPGSDFLCGGEYSFGNELPTNKYVKGHGGLIPFLEWDHYIDLVKTEKAYGIMNYNNMEDLKQLVTDPGKTIAVCHVPRKFDNIENCVDMAYFAEKEDKSLMPGIVIEESIRKEYGDVSPQVLNDIAKNKGFTLKRENRGNEDLKQLYDELGITKSISGHFHESAHRANDLDGNHVEEGKFVPDLFWNASYLDQGKAGILTVKDNKVKYRNINF